MPTTPVQSKSALYQWLVNGFMSTCRLYAHKHMASFIYIIQENILTQPDSINMCCNYRYKTTLLGLSGSLLITLQITEETKQR